MLKKIVLHFNMQSLPPIIDIPETLVDYVIEVLEALFELEGVADMTMDDLMVALLDINLSVSEDCLHLAVSTPKVSKLFF